MFVRYSTDPIINIGTILHDHFKDDGKYEALDGIIELILKNNGYKPTEGYIEYFIENESCIYFIKGIDDKPFEYIELYGIKCYILFVDYFIIKDNTNVEIGNPRYITGNSNEFNGIENFVRFIIDNEYNAQKLTETITGKTLYKASSIIAASCIIAACGKLTHNDMSGNYVSYEEVMDNLSKGSLSLLGI